MEKIEIYCDNCGDKIKNKKEVYNVEIRGGIDNPNGLIASFDFCELCSGALKYSIERAMEIRRILK